MEQQINKSLADIKLFVAKAKQSKEKIAFVMGEFAKGKLKGSDGKKITDKDQALAIAYSEAGLSNVTKAYPIGTVRHWANGDFKKVADGSWEKISDRQSTTEQQTRPAPTDTKTEVPFIEVFPRKEKGPAPAGMGDKVNGGWGTDERQYTDEQKAQFAAETTERINKYTQEPEIARQMLWSDIATPEIEALQPRIKKDMSVVEQTIRSSLDAGVDEVCVSDIEPFIHEPEILNAVRAIKDWSAKGSTRIRIAEAMLHAGYDPPDGSTSEFNSEGYKPEIEALGYIYSYLKNAKEYEGAVHRGVQAFDTSKIEPGSTYMLEALSSFQALGQYDSQEPGAKMIKRGEKATWMPTDFDSITGPGEQFDDSINTNAKLKKEIRETMADRFMADRVISWYPDYFQQLKDDWVVSHPNKPAGLAGDEVFDGLNNGTIPPPLDFDYADYLRSFFQDRYHTMADDYMAKYPGNRQIDMTKVKWALGETMWADYPVQFVIPQAKGGGGAFIPELSVFHHEHEVLMPAGPFKIISKTVNAKNQTIIVMQPA